MTNSRMSRLVRKLRNGIRFARDQGIGRFAREVCYRTANYYHERRLGVNTGGYIECDVLGFDNRNFHPYAPIGYNAVYQMLKRIPRKTYDGAFLDYGSGKGRALVVAATFPFKRVIGVELSAQLLAAARRNVAGMRCKRAEAVELCEVDAERYTVPSDVNVIYFFNPFQGKTLDDVIANVRDSYERAPRNIYILYFNDHHFQTAIAGMDWIRPVYRTQFYFGFYQPLYSCGIYLIAGPPRSDTSVALHAEHANKPLIARPGI